METRLNAYKASPDAIAAMTRLEEYVGSCGLEHSLIHLVKTRASQINGCAYCLHMHTSDARAAGESEARLYVSPGSTHLVNGLPWPGPKH